MYKITIKIDKEAEPILHLTTEKRSLARAMYLLGEENKLVIEVSTEVKSRPVKFKGIG